MSEIITTYLLNKPDTMIPMDRNEFYDEQIEVFKKTGKPTKAAAIIHIFLFNLAGEFLIQKRSDKKRHNPNLLDKTIGGHIQFRNTPGYSVMVETVQELQVPSIVLNTDEDFNKTYKLLHNYLNTIAIIKHIDTKMCNLDRLFNKDKVTIANKVYFYLGIYGGAFKTVDQEAKGVLQYSIEELEKELEHMPNMFTHDLQFLFNNYKNEIKDFLKTML